MSGQLSRSLGQPRGDQALLIYIPTYGRPRLVLEQVVRLLPQLDKNSRVHVIVSDNATQLEGDYEVEDIAREADLVDFRRNPGNLGGNANITLGFAFAAQAQYLWILADDTLLKPNAIDRVLSAISSGPDLILLADGDETYSYVYERDGLKWLMDHRAGFISNIIFRVESIRQHLDTAFLWHNSSFPHLAVAASAARARGALSVQLIAEGSVHEGGEEVGDGDYSLSHAGFPLLFWLAPEWERPILAKGWAKASASEFARVSSRFPYVTLGSRGTLIQLAGVRDLLQMHYTLRTGALLNRVKTRLRKYPYLVDRYRAFRSASLDT